MKIEEIRAEDIINGTLTIPDGVTRIAKLTKGLETIELF